MYMLYVYTERNERFEQVNCIQNPETQYSYFDVFDSLSLFLSRSPYVCVCVVPEPDCIHHIMCGFIN